MNKIGKLEGDLVHGEKIKMKNGSLSVPDYPIIPYIEGDGIGPEIMKAALKIWNVAVDITYSGKKKVIWKEIYAGKKALKKFGKLLPDETLKVIKEHLVAIKGPLTTPIGSGYRSLNVKLRQILDLYACVRPIRWIEGIETPVKNPQYVDMVIFRENTEDLYIGIEWESDSEDAKRIKKFLQNEFSLSLPQDCGIGLKIISKKATERITRKAMDYTINRKRKSLTIVHKGNIMKFTEGAFLKWARETIKKYYLHHVVFEEDLDKESEKIMIKSVITDNMFQQVLLNPSDHDVILLPNLNGDYLSDALAAQVGGVGIVPGANIGDEVAVFEPTHGTAPNIAGKGIANPISLILSGAMMFEHIGWDEVSKVIKYGVEKTVKMGKMTMDIAKDKEKALGTYEFTEEVIKNM